MTNYFKTPIPADWFGTIRQMSYDEYAAMDAINAHGLMDMLSSPGAYQQKLAAVKTAPSPSMMVGILFEQALLEPSAYKESIFVGPPRGAAEGQTVITPAMADKIAGMLAATKANSFAMDALKNAQVQPVAIWRDEATGVACKARLDAIADFAGGQRIAVDIKTARGALAADFSRAAAQYHYDLQAAHYLQAGAATGAFSADTFLFVVVQNSAPYHCVVYEASEQMLARGRAWRDQAIRLYADCRKQDSWPGEPMFQTLDLPRWAPWPKAEGDEATPQDDGLADPPDLD